VIATVVIVQVIIVTFGGEIMRTVGLSAQEWLYVGLFACILIPIDLTRKILRNLLFGNPVMTQTAK
jgi:hypothetical protein